MHTRLDGQKVDFLDLGKSRGCKSRRDGPKRVLRKLIAQGYSNLDPQRPRQIGYLVEWVKRVRMLSMLSKGKTCVLSPIRRKGVENKIRS